MKQPAASARIVTFLTFDASIAIATLGLPDAIDYGLASPACNSDLCALSSASDKVAVAQASSLLYRRFPIGRASPVLHFRQIRRDCRLEALRYSRLETCATLS